MKIYLLKVYIYNKDKRSWYLFTHLFCYNKKQLNSQIKHYKNYPYKLRFKIKEFREIKK